MATGACVTDSEPADTDGGTSGSSSSSTGRAESSDSAETADPSSTSTSGSSTSGMTSVGSTGSAETSGDSGSSTGTAEGESSSGSDETTGTDTTGGASGPLVEACQALLETYGDCYDYGPKPPGYCEYVAAGYSEYTEDCQEALADLWVCLSEADCEAFETGAVPVACVEVGLQGHDTCPELIPLCSGGSAGGGPDECVAESSGCLDGRAYAVSCDADTCSCTIDGDPAGSFPGDPSLCLAPGFAEATVESCGFPSGVFG